MQPFGADMAEPHSPEAALLGPVPPAAMQVLHWAWRDNQRLWLLATPAASAAALNIGALVEAVQGYQAHKQQQGDTPCTNAWLGCHYEAAAAVLAALNAAALAAATASLLVSAAVAASGGHEAANGVHQPLLEAEQGRKQRKSSGQWAGTRRMRLVHGTLRYLVPDTWQLKLR